MVGQISGCVVCTCQRWGKATETDSNRRGGEAKWDWRRLRVREKEEKTSCDLASLTVHQPFWSFSFSVGSAHESTCFIFGIYKELLNIHQRSGVWVKTCTQELSEMKISCQIDEEKTLYDTRNGCELWEQRFLLSRRENRLQSLLLQCDGTLSSSCHLWGEIDAVSLSAEM